MGPDNSGRAVRRFFTQKGFARKMLRGGALRLYGLRTALYFLILKLDAAWNTDFGYVSQPRWHFSVGPEF